VCEHCCESGDLWILHFKEEFGITHVASIKMRNLTLWNWAVCSCEQMKLRRVEMKVSLTI
jgi:hypothetical protein